MACKFQLIFLSLLICTTLSNAQNTLSKPKALVLPVTKDASTLQYLARLSFGTPSMQKNFVVDLRGRQLWMNCDDEYDYSSTYKPGTCGSAACSVANANCVSLCPAPQRPGCNNNTCRLFTLNTVRGTFADAEIALDTVTLQSTDGSKSLSHVSISNFIFGCVRNWSLIDLASSASGMLGLAKERASLPTQISSAFGGSIPRKFAICLPSNSKSNGVLFFGDSPYVFYPSYNTSKAIDVSTRMMYTRFHANYETTATPRIQGAQIPEYFVKVTSILVEGKAIPVNTTLLDFHRSGVGGSRITTVKPYTLLESSIYNSLVKAFDKEIATWNVSKVAPVAPFRDCYNVRNLPVTSSLGLGVPLITLVFENKNVYWDIHGANSMVEISDEVACLGFLVGEEPPFLTTSIDIGAHQMQDNLIHFDLAANRMGFTSTLLLAEVECSNFKF